jgi:hypothetical protein
MFAYDILTTPAATAFSVPDHKTLKPGLLRRLIRDAQIDVDEFQMLLGGDS